MGACSSSSKPKSPGISNEPRSNANSMASPSAASRKGTINHAVHGVIDAGDVELIEQEDGALVPQFSDFRKMTSQEQKAYMMFEKYCSDGNKFWEAEGLENFANDMAIDEDLLRAILMTKGLGKTTLLFRDFMWFWSKSDRFEPFQGDKFEALSKWLEHFESLDTLGLGVLSKKQMLAFYTKHEKEMKEDFTSLWNRVDVNGSGTIDFMEFMKMYNYPIYAE